MKLVIIEGPTATGKSALARRLGAELGTRICLKDEYKERAFDALGHKPNYRDLKRIENKSWQVVFDAVKAAVDANESIIVEGNFFVTHRRRFKALLKEDTVVAEIFCYARGLTILRRYIKRNKTGERHPGHRDNLWYGLVALEALIIWLEIYIRPVRLAKRILRVNTSDFKAVDYEEIKRFIEAA